MRIVCLHGRQSPGNGRKHHCAAGEGTGARGLSAQHQPLELWPVHSEFRQGLRLIRNTDGLDVLLT